MVAVVWLLMFPIKNQLPKHPLLLPPLLSEEGIGATSQCHLEAFQVKDALFDPL